MTFIKMDNWKRESVDKDESAVKKNDNSGSEIQTECKWDYGKNN